MQECDSYSKNLIPLVRAVNAAIIDSWEDIGKVQQRYTHWGAREFKKLNRQVLKTGKRQAIITINRSTNTATLPADFYEETFVGILDNGKKYPLVLRTDLVDSKNVDEIECVDRCPKCNQDKAICNDLTITEDTTLVTIEGSNYEQTVIKKLYPNGDYYLETKIPIWDIVDEQVVFTTQKEFITAIDLKPCGCIDDTPENVEKIQCCCPDVYYSHYAPCDNSCIENYGGYKIFEGSGLIQFDKIGKFKTVYLEYRGYLHKKNGQYHIPEVAFETIVEGIKFKAIEAKRNVPNNDKLFRLEMYRNARKNMEKELGRISLSQIVQSIGMTPKFDVTVPFFEGGCVSPPTYIAPSVVTEDTECEVAYQCPTPTAAATFTPFDIAKIAGVADGPTVGGNTYQNDKLKGAIGVNLIIVNNNSETALSNQWALNTTTGVLTRYQADGTTPNNWQAGDTLIVPTFFKLV